MQFSVLKILFIDLLVAFGDTGADFAQAYYLCTHEDEDLRWIDAIVYLNLAFT